MDEDKRHPRYHKLRTAAGVFFPGRRDVDGRIRKYSGWVAIVTALIVTVRMSLMSLIGIIDESTKANLAMQAEMNRKIQQDLHDVVTYHETIVRDLAVLLDRKQEQAPARRAAPSKSDKHGE